MAVKIGSARIGENGRITGGKAGDQTGNEVSTQNWYKHSKGWRVFRAKDSAKGEKIAVAMERACANNKIGYNQNQRSLLWSMVKSKGYDPGQCSDSSNTDCSALVRVCCAYAGIIMNDFNTASEPSALAKSGAFEELTGSKYTASSDYLCRGDVLVTKTKGHTVVVLSNGAKAGGDRQETPAALGDRILANGCEGEDVRQLQSMLIQLGYSCGSWGADGDFGDATEIAVTSFQKDHGCDPDGVFGSESYAAMLKALDEADINPSDPKQVKIINGNCFVREVPSANEAKIGVAHIGDTYAYLGETSADGWNKINYKGEEGWVSGKYSSLIDG